jgi:hypothetical protein
VFSQVDELEEVLVEPRPLAVLAEKRFVGSGRAGGDNHPVQVQFLDLVRNGGKAVLRTGVEVPLGTGHAG